jgi:hypothetical protein
MQKSIDHDIEEYQTMPSVHDGFDWNNAEWDNMEIAYWTEIIQAHPEVIMP